MTVPAGLVNRGHLDHIKDEVVFYDHQVEAVRELARRTSFILADEMGLGKTLTALAIAACDWHQGRARRGLVVAPAGLKGNWVDEITQFTNFTSLVLPNKTTAHKRSQVIAQFNAGRTDWLIVNYEQAVTHLVELNRLGFDVTICDEAHYIKGPDSARSRATRAMMSKRWFLLTGSPLLNHVDDMWALLNRVEPSKWPSYWSFVARYAVYGGYKDKQIVGTKNPRELEAAVRNVMVRRLKRDCLDLPEKQYILLKVDLHPEQQKLYDEVTKELQLTIPNNPDPKDIENALSKMLHLKMICGTTATIEGYKDHSLKLDLAVERIQELVNNGKKVVVFTQFRKVLAAMGERLAALNVTSWSLHGDVPIEQRQPLINQWSAGEPGALLCMLQVGGVGLNMTAADTCIFLDKLWSPKLNEQAEDRIHRIGASRTQPVQIISILVRNTVESRVEQILKSKRKESDDVLGDSDRGAWTKKLIQSVMEEEGV